MKVRSSITPLGQVAIGGLVLVACLAYPPLLILVALYWVIRGMRRAGRARRQTAVLTAVALMALSVGLAYLWPNYTLVLLGFGLAGVVWLVAAQIRLSQSGRLDTDEGHEVHPDRVANQAHTLPPL